jgi:hypothetical protein
MSILATSDTVNGGGGVEREGPSLAIALLSSVILNSGAILSMKYNVRDDVRNGCELIRKLFQILGFPSSIGNQINIRSVRVMMASIENDNKTSTVCNYNFDIKY